jgi:dethiobiotin synthetase
MVVRLFVTGTDTGVGKTEVASALLERLVEQGEAPRAFKPYESGPGGDARRLQVAGGGAQPLETVSCYCFRAPLAPGLAARLEGRRTSLAAVERAFRALGPGSLVVEGAGGLFVPLEPRHDVIHLIARLGLPALLVARAGLGTINHTTLSLLALEAANVPVAAVVLVQAQPGRDPSVPWNQPELQRRFPAVPILGPVPYRRDPRRRRRVLQAALAPLTRADEQVPA